MRHHMKQRITVSLHRQTGYATLFIGVSLFFMATLLTGYLAKTGLSDIKSAADKNRYSQALAAAESNIEVIIGWMRPQNSEALAPAAWAQCDTLTTNNAVYNRYVESNDWDNLFPGAAWRCIQRQEVNGGTTHIAYIAATQIDGTWNYTIIGAGTSDDASASAVVKQGVRYMFETQGEAPAPPPIMGAGEVGLKGGFNVVTNPNGGGQGVPVSVWTSKSVDDSNGNWSSCQIDEFYTYKDSCDTKALSSKGNINADIVANDPNFPADMFQYFFRVNEAQHELIKFNPQTTTILTNCDSLGAEAAALTASRIFWITGECDIKNDVIPAGTNQIAVVVEQKDFTLNAGNTMRGLLFMFGPNNTAGSIKANGTATLIGSMASNNGNLLGLNTNGTFNLIYSNQVWQGVQGNLDDAIEVAKIPGTWADYLR